MSEVAEHSLYAKRPYVRIGEERMCRECALKEKRVKEEYPFHDVGCKVIVAEMPACSKCGKNLVQKTQPKQ